MPKQLQENEEIYIAPGIKGKYDDRGIPTATDERNNNRTLDPRTTDHKILIYEREVEEWFLKPASDLLQRDSFHNGFIVLMICMSYFEGVEQYKTGIESKDRSKECFKDSVKRLYPERFEDKELNELYSKSRCGLFHNGMVKGGVIFSDVFGSSIAFQNAGGIIEINPRKLLEDIKEDFERYISELKTTSSNDSRTARENFGRMFTVLPDRNRTQRAR